MRVCVIGTGYVGLVTGACLAHIGHEVICIDNNAEKVKLMQSGKSPIYEPGLVEIMQSAMAAGLLSFTTDLSAGVAHGEVLFIAVGTPPLPTGESDTRYVEAVARGIGTHLTADYKVIVNKSTVPIGSGDWVRQLILSELGTRQLVSNNAFLATKISFINEIANICDRVGADVTQVAKGIGLDSRIGNKFLQAGIGWGGSCFPKDVSALVSIAKDYGYEAELLQATVKVNQRQRLLVVEKLQQVLKILKGKTIGLLGLTFKPDTDDFRDAPALNLIEELSRLGAKVKAYDPIFKSVELLSTPVELATSPEQLARDCDALVVVTEWPEFSQIDYSQITGLMRNNIIVDGRNFLDREELSKAGFYYIGIGRSEAGDRLIESSLNETAIDVYLKAA
jgi:UDP-glucose 6-dehydrogenase